MWAYRFRQAARRAASFLSVLALCGALPLEAGADGAWLSLEDLHVLFHSPTAVQKGREVATYGILDTDHGSGIWLNVLSFGMGCDDLEGEGQFEVEPDDQGKKLAQYAGRVIFFRGMLTGASRKVGGSENASAGVPLVRTLGFRIVDARPIRPGEIPCDRKSTSSDPFMPGD